MEVSSQHPSRVYVDALDEGGEESAVNLIQQLQSLIKQSRTAETLLQVIFSCRYYPIIALDGFDIEVEKENSSDINTHVHQQFQSHSIGPKKAAPLTKTILERARGIFQWVTLVLPRVLSECKRGKSVESIQRTIRKLPPQLHDLYQFLLAEIPDEDREYTLRLLRVVLLARRPLSVTEVRHAILIGPESSYTSWQEYLDHEDFTEDDEDMENRIVDLSKGLLEVKAVEEPESVISDASETDSSSDLSYGSQRHSPHIVQVIHESVSDYLISEKGLDLLSNGIQAATSGHEQLRLAWICVRYMLLAEIRLAWSEYVHSDTTNSYKDDSEASSLSPNEEPRKRDYDTLARRYPFLDYCVEFWFKHAAEADKIENAAEGLAELFRYLHPQSEGYLDHWISMFHASDDAFPQPYHLEFHSGIEHIISAEGMINVFRKLHAAKYIDFGKRNQKGFTMLHSAVRHGQEEFAKMLLEIKDVDVNAQDTHGNTALLSTMFNRSNRAIVEAFLALDTIQPDLNNTKGLTAFSYAAKHSSLHIFQLFLGRDDVDHNWRDNRGCTPLHLASQIHYERRSKVALLLAQDRVDINLKNIYGQSPLSYAAESGARDVVALILTRADAEANSRDTNSRSPLSYAAELRTKDVVELFLAREDVEVDSRDDEDRSPLSYAAEHNAEEVIELFLVREDVEADSRDENGRSPLSYAVRRGNKKVVELFLAQEDIEADSRDHRGRSPLSYAAQFGDKEIIELFLAREDIEADSRDHRGRSPLSYAAQFGNKKAIELFLAREDVEVDSKDGNRRSPHSYAAQFNTKRVIELFLARVDVEADSKTSNGQSPLSYAAQRGNKEIIELFLAREDIEADSRDHRGRSPLSYAAQFCNKKAIELFLAREDIEADSRDYNGRSPLSHAAHGGNEEAVKLLLAREDVEADSRNNSGRSPLSYAIEYGNKEVIELFVAREDVEADSRDNVSWSPLSCAVQGIANEEIARKLASYSLGEIMLKRMQRPSTS
jgi:ankyrin repeat protein